MKLAARIATVVATATAVIVTPTAAAAEYED